MPKTKYTEIYIFYATEDYDSFIASPRLAAWLGYEFQGLFVEVSSYALEGMLYAVNWEKMCKQIKH